MKLIIHIIVASSLILMSCQASIDLSETHEVKPCDDKLYLELKAKDFSKLTGQEQKYLKMKEKECKEYLKEAKEEGSIVFLIVFGSIAALFALALLILGNSSWH